MRITRADDAPDGPVDAEHFTGSVTRRDYGALPDPEGAALHVSFSPGARTHWHSHPAGQILFVTDGSGRVATRGGSEVEIRRGDLVYAPPGEEHWHGAGVDAPMRHLAVSFGGTRWLEPVED